MDKLIETVLTALIMVESGGDPLAVGDNGRAVGILQIHPAYWADANRIMDTNWPLEWRTDPHASYCHAFAYLLHYGTVYERKAGKKATAEVLSRLHVSGPYNPNKKTGREWPKKSDEYWAKVQKALKAQEAKP